MILEISVFILNYTGTLIMITIVKQDNNCVCNEITNKRKFGLL